MSDYSLSLVPAVADYPAPPQQAAALLAWLVAQQVVAPEASRCTLGQALGYTPASGAGAVSTQPQLLPYKLATNGLEILTGRQVFDTGSLELTALWCPNCAHNVVAEDWDLSPWASQESDQLTCPRCGVGAAPNAYRFEPTWGFSNLGFCFWNWPPFTPQFLAHVAQQLGCPVVVVQRRL